MTRNDAISKLKALHIWVESEEIKEALEMAIQSLEVEPIEKLKAEIYNATMDNYYMPTKLLSCDEITEIIDRYINGGDTNEQGV